MTTIQLEYRVRKVERFVVTRYTSSAEGIGNSGTVEGRGEYDNPELAYEVAYALCKREHQMLGWPLADDRIRYPLFPGAERAVKISHEAETDASTE